MKFAFEITAEDKAAFIEMIYAGHKANTAAGHIGTTGSVMRRLRRPGAFHYDEKFAKAWQEAEASEEHRRNREEELRALVDERSRVSDSILAKRMMAELPEYEVLRHQNFRHDVNLQLALSLFPGMTNEELEAIKERLIEQQKPDVRLLPPASSDAA